MVLRSERLEVKLDPRRGGEIASARSRVSGRELLFRSPWEPSPPPDRGADGDTWVADWGGGWQLLFPNAGEVCEVDGRRHPFHGDAALAAWSVCRQSESEATLAWSDRSSGVSVERTTRVDGATVSVSSEVVNEGAAAVPYVFVEHAIFGAPLLAATSRVALPGGRIVPLDASGRPAGEGSAWPLLDGDDWSSMRAGRLGRFGAIVEMPRGHARLVDEASGIAATLTWPVRQLPYLWYWLESCDTPDPPWDARTVCIGLEPASVPVADGLGAALERGLARSLEPGADERFSLTVAFEERGADEQRS